MKRHSNEHVYVTPNGFPGIHRKGDEQIVRQLERTYTAELERHGFDKAHKRLIERVEKIIQTEQA